VYEAGNDICDKHLLYLPNTKKEEKKNKKNKVYKNLTWKKKVVPFTICQYVFSTREGPTEKCEVRSYSWSRPLWVVKTNSILIHSILICSILFVCARTLYKYLHKEGGLILKQVCKRNINRQ
jgi:hypothetical protein